MFRERWKTFRKAVNTSIWNRLAARTGYPCSGCLHGYRCYLHVASQSLTLLFKICHMLTLCVGSFLLQDMYLSLQVLAFVGKVWHISWTNKILGKILDHIFTSNGGHFVYFSTNVLHNTRNLPKLGNIGQILPCFRSRDPFRPITREQKYLMDYRL